MNPLNRVHSSADVQAVMVHFIIIGSATSGEERDIKDGVEERQIREMGRVRQERTSRGREGYMSRQTSRDGAKGGGKRMGG